MKIHVTKVGANLVTIQFWNKTGEVYLQTVKVYDSQVEKQWDTNFEVLQSETRKVTLAVGGRLGCRR